MIKAALFDLGGTLYDYATLQPGEQEGLRALAGWAGVDVPAEEVARAYRKAMGRVFQRYLPRPFYLHRDLFREAITETLADLGAEPADGLFERYTELQRRHRQRDLRLRQGTGETLEALRARGLVLGIVSNIDEDQLQETARAGDLGRRFDWMLSSETAGSCKPDPGIFRMALARAGCAAREALFVGDTLRQDIVGARRAGMRSVLLWHRDDRAPPHEPVEPDHVLRRIPDLIALLDGAPSGRVG